MGRHSGSGDGTAGTDAGPAFKDLTPQQKADEFDASIENAPAYAARNFGAGQSHGEQYDAARAEQREQQNGQ